MTVPRCSAPRRDGRACGTLAARPDARFCKRHEALVEKWGEERVLRGDYPGNARKRDSVMEADPPEPVAPVVIETNGDSVADPGSIRPALAQLAAANLNELQRTLLDAALNASTSCWATVRCSSCQARSRVELPMPDVKSRLMAVQMLLSESLRKAPTAAEVTTPSLPRTARDVQRMDWSTMTHVFALSYADELREVNRLGGPQALRQKLSRLSAPERAERRVLRDALSQLDGPFRRLTAPESVHLETAFAARPIRVMH
jgi:hypothetical protein